MSDIFRDAFEAEWHRTEVRCSLRELWWATEYPVRNSKDEVYYRMSYFTGTPCLIDDAIAPWLEHLDTLGATVREVVETLLLDGWQLTWSELLEAAALAT